MKISYGISDFIKVTVVKKEWILITLTFYIIEIKNLRRNIYDCTVTLFFSLIFCFVTVNFNSWGYIRII